MTNRIRWGIMSTGNIANQFASDLQLASGAELLAVGSRSEETALAFAAKHNIPRYYGSYEALVEDADLDVIYIGTPNSEHLTNALLCLDAGKPVLLEKTFTINAEEAALLIERARERKLFMMEAMWTRFLPVMVQVRRLLDEGVIGDLRQLSVDFGIWRPFNPEHRIFNPELGGGALLDVGVYPISFASWVFGGPPAQFESSVHFGQTGVDEQFSLLFSYEGGRMATISAGVNAATQRQATIAGTDGMIKVLPMWNKSNTLVLQLRGHDEQRIETPFEGVGYQFEADEVMRCLRAGKLESEIMPLDETLSIMQTLDEIRAQWDMTYPMEGV